MQRSASGFSGCQPTIYSKNHIPFSLAFYNDWDGWCGGQLMLKYTIYMSFLSLSNIRSLGLHQARWSYFKRQVHQPPDQAFLTLQIVGLCLCSALVLEACIFLPSAYFSSPYCTCSYEKWSFYKVRKHSRKGACTKYQICRFSKVYS